MIKNVQTLLSRMKDNAGANRIPMSGSFEITSRCNLHCSMCYICNPLDAKNAELSAGQWVDIMRQARDQGMLFAMLTGGEPLVREDFWDIYLEARRLGLLITLNTNATIITPEVADLLAKYPPVRVAATIYGASPEGYRRVTGSASAYGKMLRGIELMRERGLNFRLRTTLTRGTLPDMKGIIELILEQKARPSFTNYIMPTLVENGNDCVSQRLSPEEAAEATRLIYRTMREYISKHGDPREKELAEHMSELETDRLIPLDPEQEELHSRSAAVKKDSAFYCQAGTSHFWVTYNGLMTMCGLSREPSFDLRKLSFADAFAELGKAVVAIPACEECRGCEYRRVCSPCPAKLFCENGRYDRRAAYLCSFAKAGIEVRE